MNQPQKISSRFWDDDRKVIDPSRRANITMATERLPNPVFGDGLWDMNALVGRVNLAPSAARINFDKHFPDPMRHLTARELAMQRLNRPLNAVGATPTRIPAVTTIIYAINSLRLFFDFMDDHGLRTLAEIDQPFLNRYILYLRDRKDVTAHHVATRIGVIFWLYEARSVLTSGGIQFLPWPNLTASQIFNLASGIENKTPRIPETIMQPLLKWAIDYVYNFADEIITNYYLTLVSRRYHLRQIEQMPGLRGLKERQTRLRYALVQVPDYAHRPYIEQDFTPTSSGLTLYGIPLTKPAFSSLASEAEDLGLNLIDVSTSPGILNATGKPWRPPFNTPLDMIQECRNLISACYIVCAYLSGMRDSEIQGMKVGCVSVLRDADGTIVRRYVSAAQYKGRSINGQERTWVVTEHVAKAVEVMTRLGSAERRAKGVDQLFIFLHNTKIQSTPNLKNQANAYINDFISHVNDVLVPWANHELAQTIPIHQFRPLSTRMFRRTVAWYIANHPYGTIAGMLQYGHLSTQMFEGYSGTSEAGFRQEVEAERALARMADIIEMYEEFKVGKKPAGPMAPTLNGEFQLARDTSHDFPGKIVDIERRNKMLGNWSRQLYPGLLADCFFDPGQAHCLTHVDKADRKEPVSGFCNPHCKNACWRNRHLGVWQAALDDVDKLAKKNRLSEPQRMILSEKKREYRNVISQIKEANNGIAS